MESIFPLLLTTLSYPNEEVVQNDLKVIAIIISPSATQTNNKQYFDHFILSLLKQFSCDRTLLKDRGQFIIRFCVYDMIFNSYKHGLNISTPGY